jgi:hypothetical protein
VLTINDIAFTTAVLRQNPTMYPDELQHELHARRGVYVFVPTLFRTLSRLLNSRNDISARALERDEERHAIFLNHIGEMAPNPESECRVMMTYRTGNILEAAPFLRRDFENR